MSITRSKILTLPESFYESSLPEKSSSPDFLGWNSDLAQSLGLPIEPGEPERRIFLQNHFPQDIEPIAQVYAGHQFGHFVPQLGDGRALLLGELGPYEVQIKGSGRTAYSRNGDGKSALGPVLREYLVSEAMNALGVPSTRALAAISTGDLVQRETALPGGLLVRLASSYLRVGSFEYFYQREETSLLQRLLDYALEKLYPQCLNSKSPYLSFFESVIERQARLVAQWMSLGFVHGVMNTDNVSIAGETLDYGPCAFLDEFRWMKVFSSIDRGARYAYGKQANIMHWNMAVLGQCLSPFLEQKEIQKALDKFPQFFEKYWMERLAQKFGFLSLEETKLELIQERFKFIEESEIDFTQSFHELTEQLESHTPSSSWFSRWQTSLESDGLSKAEVLTTLKKANPIHIPRNHWIEKAIQKAYQKDYSLFSKLCEVYKAPYSKNDQWEEFNQAPKPNERITKTFCGT